MTKIELALTDFQFFTEHYLGLKLWECQKSWQNKVQTVMDGEYVGLQCLGPADHGKTSRVVIPLILWIWARDRKNRIILCGNTDDYSEQIGRAVMNRIDRQQKLGEDFGLKRGIKWAANEMHIERPNWEDKDPSLLCVGAGAEIQSQRADFIITDDICTRRNSRTEQQRQSLNSYFETDLGSRLDSTSGLGKGKTFIFGHRVEPSDLYGTNLGREDWVYVEDRAIVDDSQEKILCPEGHTYKKLNDKRMRDPIGFELLYQQRAAGTGKFVTRSAMESVRRADLKFANYMTPELRGQFKFTWLTLDPAFTVQRWSSYAVFMLWGMKLDGTRTLLWALRDKVVPETLHKIMEMKFRLYNPDHFCIEDNQAQTLLLSHMRRKFPEQASKFKSITTTSSNGSLEDDLCKIFEMYNHDKPIIEIPYSGPTEQAFAHAMLEEYIAYPDGKTRDILMSQYIGEKGLGLIKDEKRTGYKTPYGIMGNVARTYRRRFKLL